MKNKNVLYLFILIAFIVLAIILNKFDIIHINVNLPSANKDNVLVTPDNQIMNSQNDQVSNFYEFSRCKKENINGSEFSVFEGWADNFSAYESERDGVSIFNIYNVRVSEDNPYTEITADFSKIYIMENGVTRKLNMSEYHWNEEDLWNFKVYYKIGALDDSLDNRCPGWEGDLTNVFIYQIVLQKPIFERQTITTNKWQCFDSEILSLWHNGNWIVTSDITPNESCNIKFANRDGYSYVPKCDFLDLSMINSLKIEGNLAHSKFNDTKFFYPDNFYFDTKLSIDKDTNISMGNFVYNSKEFAEDTQSFDLLNYNMNNYWKTRNKTVVNKYYLQPYLGDCSDRCYFYWWSNLLIDISDNISDNTSLSYLINKVEQKQVNNGAKYGIIDESVGLDFKANGTLYCGRLINFMERDNQYACILKPDTVVVSKIDN